MEKMCGIDEYLYNKGLKTGKKEGIELGVEQGLLMSIKNLMASMSIGVVEAMNLLQVKKEDQPKYSKLILE